MIAPTTLLFAAWRRNTYEFALHPCSSYPDLTCLTAQFHHADFIHSHHRNQTVQELVVSTQHDVVSLSCYQNGVHNESVILSNVLMSGNSSAVQNFSLSSVILHSRDCLDDHFPVFGIGKNNPDLNEYILTPNLLIINPPRNHSFASHCVTPEYESGTLPPWYVLSGSFRFWGVPTSVEFGDDDDQYDENEIIDFKLDTMKTRSVLPDSKYDLMIEKLLEAGFQIRDTRNINGEFVTSVDECNLGFRRRRLPTITLWVQSNVDVIVSKIVLEADDYLSRDCVIKLQRSGMGNVALLGNDLLRTMAIHFIEPLSHISICDAL